MTAILWRLQTSFPSTPTPYGAIEEKKYWNFQQSLRQESSLLASLVPEHVVLTLEYSIHCTQLARDLIEKGGDSPDVIRQLEQALMMAELLEELYVSRDYLNMPDHAERFCKDKRVYRQLLGSQYQFDTSEEKDLARSLDKKIRERTAPLNLFRLFMARVRRLCLMILPLAQDIEESYTWVDNVDKVALPFFTYAAWIIFIPRLSQNLFSTIKHTLPHRWWMSEGERSLGWKTRFRAQMASRWFELGNDTASFSVNILICFALVGLLAPIATYITTALLTYDVILACLRADKELTRLRNLQLAYQELLSNPKLSDAEVEQINGYLKHSEERMVYEKKRMKLLITNASLLLFAFVLTLPLIVINPFIPLVGALLAVCITVAFYYLNKRLMKTKPNDTVVAEPKTPTPETSPKKSSGVTLFGCFRRRSPVLPVTEENCRLGQGPTYGNNRLVLS